MKKLTRKSAARLRKLREATRVSRAEYARKWREANPEYNRRWHEANPEYSAEASRKYITEHPGYKNKYNRKYAEKYPARERANRKLNRAVISGRIKKPANCHLCEGTDIQAHHYDLTYQIENDLSVVWLCRLHHKFAHANGVTIIGLELSTQLHLDLNPVLQCTGTITPGTWTNTRRKPQHLQVSRGIS